MLRKLDGVLLILSELQEMPHQVKKKEVGRGSERESFVHYRIAGKKVVTAETAANISTKFRPEEKRRSLHYQTFLSIYLFLWAGEEGRK